MSQSERIIAEKVSSLLAYCNPYAQANELEPSPAHPSQFTAEMASKYPYLYDSYGDCLNPETVGAALARDPAPIPAKLNREGYAGDQHFAYWLSGLGEYFRIKELAQRYGVTTGQLFDFGGSTGRVFRHFLYQSQEWDVWTADFKRTSVEWNLENFHTTRLVAFQGSYFPLLPIEDNSVDLIIAMSVFTHIDETETAWLLELRRILKRGSIALITIHNEVTWKNMPPFLNETFFKFRDDLIGIEDMPDGRHVSTFRGDDPYRCNVFHSNAYVARQWSRYFRLREIISKFSGAQAVCVLQKP